MTNILPAASMPEGDGGPHVQRYFRYGHAQASCRLDSEVPVLLAIRGEHIPMTVDDLRDLGRLAAEAAQWCERAEQAAAAVAQVQDIARRSVALGETPDLSRDDAGPARAAA